LCAVRPSNRPVIDAPVSTQTVRRRITGKLKPSTRRPIT
jgi:hypothetical protein